MIRPEFSCQVRNVRKDGGMSAERQGRRRTFVPDSEYCQHRLEEKQTRQLVQSYAKEGTWQGKGPRSPRERRRSKRHPIYASSSLPQAKEDQLDLSVELREVGKRLQICHQDFTSSYMKRIIRDMDERKSSDADQVAALKELFQRLNIEMIHLKTLLSSHIDINYKSHHNEMNSFADHCMSTSHAQSSASHNSSTDDLIQLNGPLTENTIITTLHERFSANCYHTRVGSVLLALNPFGSLESEEDIQPAANNSPFIKKLIRESLQQLFDTQDSQILILSGESGSGKSFTAQRLIRQLLCETCGGVQTDLAKQLVASATVLQSLGKARTTNNTDSSRVAKLYEFYFSNQIIARTKIRCFTLDMSRIVRPRKGERNFHIFYQLFAGLSPTDRVKLQLQTHSAHELRYLYNYPVDCQSEIEVLRKQFQSWKLALLVLGIPFSDVTKVLAAILLLGNVEFVAKTAGVLEVQGGDFELKAVAVLLGVSYSSLLRGVTKRSKVMRGEITVVSSTSAQANATRDALSKALYSRTFSAIVRRCNSSRKSTSSQESSPSSSSESISKINNLGDKANKANNTFTNCIGGDTQVIGNPDALIGVADVFGFENTECNGMEQICTNLCSETIQHFYTTHIFKSTEGYCREEGLQNEVDVDYVDNTLCIELLTCQRSGILTYLDRETLDVCNGSPERFMDQMHGKLGRHEKFFTSTCDRLEFGVVHYSSEVVYNAKELFLNNNDSIVDDVIRIFSKQHCNFGFVTHLFAADLDSTLTPEKVHGDEFTHKISPSSHVTGPHQSTVSSSSMRTVSQDFQGKLDGLLKTLVRAKPWFILCLKSNCEGTAGVFDHEAVSKQAKSLQVFETVYLLRSGYTHRMRILPFVQRYFASRDDTITQDGAVNILNSHQRMFHEEWKENPNKLLFIGKKHVFFSELMWQDLETDRREKEVTPEHFQYKKFSNEETFSLRERKLRNEEISSTSSDEVTETTCVLADIDVSTPPPIPKRRSYTVIKDKKIAFPQIRIMKEDYKDIANGQEVLFNYGETVKVIGASPKAGFLTVETRDKTGWVPYKLTKLMTDSS